MTHASGMCSNRPNRQEPVRLTQTVCRLIHHEPLCVDPDAILLADHNAMLTGQSKSLSQLSEELAHSLHEVTVTLASDEDAALVGAVRRIGRIGIDLGLPDLQRVAKDVLTCSISADTAALAATTARLLRLARQVLLQLREWRPPS